MCFPYVVSPGKKLQILQGVVLSVCVAVVYCIFSGVWFSQESQGNQTMYIVFLSLDTYLLVSLAVVKLFLYDCLVSAKGFYTAFIANKKPFLCSWYVLPYLAGNVLDCINAILCVEYLSINPLQPYLMAFSRLVIQHKGVGLAGDRLDLLVCPGFLYHALAVDLIKRKGLDLKKSIVFHPIIPPTSWQ